MDAPCEQLASDLIADLAQLSRSDQVVDYIRAALFYRLMTIVGNGDSVGHAGLPRPILLLVSDLLFSTGVVKYFPDAVTSGYLDAHSSRSGVPRLDNKEVLDIVDWCCPKLSDKDAVRRRYDESGQSLFMLLLTQLVSVDEENSSNNPTSVYYRRDSCETPKSPVKPSSETKIADAATQIYMTIRDKAVQTSASWHRLPSLEASIQCQVESPVLSAEANKHSGGRVTSLPRSGSASNSSCRSADVAQGSVGTVTVSSCRPISQFSPELYPGAKHDSPCNANGSRTIQTMLSLLNEKDRKIERLELRLNNTEQLKVRSVSNQCCDVSNVPVRRGDVLPATSVNVKCGQACKTVIERQQILLQKLSKKLELLEERLRLLPKVRDSGGHEVVSSAGRNTIDSRSVEVQVNLLSDRCDCPGDRQKQTSEDNRHKVSSPSPQSVSGHPPVLNVVDAARQRLTNLWAASREIDKDILSLQINESNTPVSLHLATLSVPDYKWVHRPQDSSLPAALGGLTDT